MPIRDLDEQVSAIWMHAFSPDYLGFTHAKTFTVSRSRR
jgi:hypothetical protein